MDPWAVTGSDGEMAMRLTAPAGFDAAEFYREVYTFQSWEIFPGHVVPGAKPVGEHLQMMGIAPRLNDARVLEIGPWNGFFGFELLRRGARELVALGPDDPDATGFHRTARLLEIEDRVKYIRGSVYNIAQHQLGTFDLVLFLGVIYHLRHPLLALDVLHDHCAENATVLIDSPTIDMVKNVAAEADCPTLQPSWEAVGGIPLTTFVRGDVAAPLARDNYNWFIPNSPCFRAWVVSSGYAIEHEHNGRDWISVRARPVARPFQDGLEGYNPLAQYRCAKRASG